MKKVLVTGITGMVGSRQLFLLKNTNEKLWFDQGWSPLDNIDHILNLANKEKNKCYLC